MNSKTPNADNANTPRNDANKDPISGKSGAHPVGVTLGAVGAGAAAGAAGGAIAGPVGAVAGAAVGAVVGGLAGKAAAEMVNPTIEAKYWNENHSSRPYANSAYGYDEFAPAYRYGWESYANHGKSDASFDSVESELARGWAHAKGASRLGWEQAKSATKDAWDRVKSATHTADRTD